METRRCFFSLCLLSFLPLLLFLSLSLLPPNLPPPPPPLSVNKRDDHRWIIRTPSQSESGSQSSQRGDISDYEPGPLWKPAALGASRRRETRSCHPINASTWTGLQLPRAGRLLVASPTTLSCVEWTLRRAWSRTMERVNTPDFVSNMVT